MGLFDSVWVKCPKCGNMVEFQSKAGDCIMKDYDLSDAPPIIIADIAGDTGRCDQCNHVWALEVAEKSLLRGKQLKMRAVRAEEIYMIATCRVYTPEHPNHEKGFSSFFTSGWFNTLEEAAETMRKYPDAVFEAGQHNVAVIERVPVGLGHHSREEHWYQRDDETGKIESIEKPAVLKHVVGFAF